jgi:hypothetical protein
MAVGDFNCPKCGAKMESGHIRLVASRGCDLSFKPEYLPWKVPLEQVEEGKVKEPEYEPIIGASWKYESDAHRCPKCRLLLLGY